MNVYRGRGGKGGASLLTSYTQTGDIGFDRSWEASAVMIGLELVRKGSKVSSRYIFKPIFHSFWLTHTLVNLPLQGPLRVYLCLACPLPSIAIGLSCTTTLVDQHLSYSPACNSVTMHYIRPPQDYPSTGTSRSLTSWLLTDHLP